MGLTPVGTPFGLSVTGSAYTTENPGLTLDVRPGDGATAGQSVYQDVYQATVVGTTLSGNQQVLNGGVSHHTLIKNGGSAYVGSGGTTVTDGVSATG